MKNNANIYKYQEIADEIARLIESGVFQPGGPVPSVRQLSSQKNVSITTVMQAYYVLEARGLIEARPRSGFFVNPDGYAPHPEPDLSTPEPDPCQVSIRELVTMVLLRDTLNPHLVHMGAAHPNPALTPMKRLNRISASLARRFGDNSGLYTLPPGCRELREQIAIRSVAAGCHLKPDDIMITSGCAEAVSLCLRAVCQPGDTVAIESPVSFDVLQWMETHGLVALEIPTHPQDGISLEALEFALETKPVKACLVISNFNNPLGSRMPDTAKKSLVEMLARRGIPLIENDIYGEIHFTTQRPMVAKAFDNDGLVMLCSSFSKSVCPGFRVGWTIPGRFIKEVEWLKYTSSIATPTQPQYTLAEFMAGGGYLHYMRQIRQTYMKNTTAMRQAVFRFFPQGTRVSRPTGGFVLWVQLPETIDSLVLYKHALKKGIAFIPGHLFSATDRYRNYLRLCAANWSEEEHGAIRRLGELIAGMD